MYQEIAETGFVLQKLRLPVDGINPKGPGGFTVNT